MEQCYGLDTFDQHHFRRYPMQTVLAAGTLLVLLSALFCAGMTLVNRGEDPGLLTRTTGVQYADISNLTISPVLLDGDQCTFSYVNESVVRRCRYAAFRWSLSSSICSPPNVRVVVRDDPRSTDCFPVAASSWLSDLEVVAGFMLAIPSGMGLVAHVIFIVGTLGIEAWAWAKTTARRSRSRSSEYTRVEMIGTDDPV